MGFFDKKTTNRKKIMDVEFWYLKTHLGLMSRSQVEYFEKNCLLRGMTDTPEVFNCPIDEWTKRIKVDLAVIFKRAGAHGEWTGLAQSLFKALQLNSLGCFQEHLREIEHQTHTAQNHAALADFLGNQNATMVMSARNGTQWRSGVPPPGEFKLQCPNGLQCAVAIDILMQCGVFHIPLPLSNIAKYALARNYLEYPTMGEKIKQMGDFYVNGVFYELMRNVISDILSSKELASNGYTTKQITIRGNHEFSELIVDIREGKHLRFALAEPDASDIVIEQLISMSNTREYDREKHFEWSYSDTCHAIHCIKTSHPILQRIQKHFELQALKIEFQLSSDDDYCFSFSYKPIVINANKKRKIK